MRLFDKMTYPTKIALAIILIALTIIIARQVRAQDLSTWRYGSPSDFKRMANYLMQHHGSDRGGYGRSGGRGGGLAAATVFDTMFRAGSPELYRQTQPQAPQTNININVYNSNEAPQYIIGPKPERKTSPLGRKPDYPAALVP